MTYNPELLTFSTTDGLNLPGLLYKPETSTDKALIYLHGNGSSSIFYDPQEMNNLASALNNQNISFFPFNNRGAHYIKSFKVGEGVEKERINLGTAFELIKDCVLDINAAVDFLKTRGYKEFYLAGISTGANKIVVYDKYQPQNDISRYILLSGGDDTGLYYEQMGKDAFFNALAEARIQMDASNGLELVPKSVLDYYMSWQSLYDTINPEGDYNIFPFNEYFNNLKISRKPLFAEFASLKKPTLVIYGELDEYCYGDVPRCVEALKEHAKGKDNFTYEIIKAADHGFNGKESELAHIISKWI